MGASSSGLLDEAKIGHVKGLVDRTFQDFSVFYRQQYSAAYCGHLHQEVEPKKEGRGLLLTRAPQYGLEEVLYQGCVKCSCWDEQGKKSKERYIILRRDYKVEIYENKESFSRGCAAKLVLKTAGGNVFTTEEESRAHLEQTCAGILNEAKEDSSSVASSPDTFAVYLHLPYTGHTCFLFQQEEERDHFLSALKTCIRHCNLDPWCASSYENQAYIQALRLYRQDKGCYESWEMLLGTEEKVLATQVMEEVLPWLQSQLQSKVKGKKMERIRQWLATVQAAYTVVLEQLTTSLEALREECRKTASANQALIRSDLDQIMSSHRFLEEKVRACICEEAEKVCSESIAPYMSSILEALTENISAGIQGMRHTLQTQMDAAFTNGGTGDTKKALSTVRSTSLDQCYRQVENLTEKLAGLKQRFGLSNVQKLVHSAHLEMETLSESAVYTLELFLQSSNRLQPSQIPVKMDRAKERVLKQLDYDSRVVQKRLYQEALLEITLPALTRRTDNKWKAELQQFEQYIFSDYSSFILVHNIYDDVLRSILSKEIETALLDATSKKTNNLLLDTSDLAISQYSLIGQTPPRSAPDSPSIHPRDSSSAAPSEEAAPPEAAPPEAAPPEAAPPEAAPPEAAPPEAAPVVEEPAQTVTVEVCLQVDPEPNADAKPDPSPSQSSDQITVLPSPVIVVTQQFDELSTEEASCFEETQEEVQVGTDTPSTTADSSNPATPDVPANPEPTDPIADSPDLSVSTSSSPPPTDVPSECAQSDQPATPEVFETPDLSTSDPAPEDSSEDSPAPCTSSSQPPSTDSPIKITLGSLSKAIGTNSSVPFVMQTMAQRITDRAVYLSGEIKDNWEVQRVKEEKQKEAEEEEEVRKTEAEKGAKEEEKEVEEREAEGKEKEKGAHERETEKEAEEEEKQSEAGEEKEVDKTDSEKEVKEEEKEGDKTQAEKEAKEEEKEGDKTEKEVKEEEKEGDKTEAEKEAKEEEKEVDETKTEPGEGKEEEKQGERAEGKMEGVAQTGESVDGGCQSSEPPAESTTVSTTEQRADEEKVDDEGRGSEVGTEERKEDEEGAEERGDHAEQEGKKEEEEKEEVPPSPQPMESEPESGAELPLDSVAIIRALVTEITEVETIIAPCPNNSHTP